MEYRYTLRHNSTMTNVSKFWFYRIYRGIGRILGCERAYARSHPKMRGFTTTIPKDSKFFTRAWAVTK